MTPDTKLRETLLRHGFPHAAAGISIHVRDVDTALATWRNYPSCMDKYPVKLTGTPKI